MSSLQLETDIIELYCDTNSFRELCEGYCSLLKEKLGLDSQLSFSLGGGCFVVCLGGGCAYQITSFSPAEGYVPLWEAKSGAYGLTLFAKETPLDEQAATMLNIIAKLLFKRVEEDDRSIAAAAKSVVSVSGITYHDVRNILGSISGIVQLIEMDLAESDEMYSSIKEISGVVDRFELSSRNTMKLYRGEPIHYIQSPVDISALYNSIIQKRKRVFSLSNVTLEATVEEGLQGSLDSDLVQLFLNELLSNAFDSFGEDGSGGEIVVEVKRESDRCAIRVVDNGAGIPYDLQRHIYKLFVTTKNKRRGTGLSVLARTLSDWGGELRFTSTPGEGSRFMALFPFVL